MKMGDLLRAIGINLDGEVQTQPSSTIEQQHAVEVKTQTQPPTPVPEPPAQTQQSSVIEQPNQTAEIEKLMAEINQLKATNQSLLNNTTVTPPPTLESSLLGLMGIKEKGE